MWPFRRKHDPKPTTEAQRAIVEAQRAKEAAQQGLKDELARWPEVTRVTSSLRRAHTRNHFSEAMEQLMRGNTP